MQWHVLHNIVILINVMHLKYQPFLLHDNLHISILSNNYYVTLCQTLYGDSFKNNGNLTKTCWLNACKVISMILWCKYLYKYSCS